eukprot:SAG31_NODE_1662_length_7590_cov_24.800828_5_plen_231_part_00
MHICHQLRVGAKPVDFDCAMDVMPWLECGYACYGQNIDAEQTANPRLIKSHLPFKKLPQGTKRLYIFRSIEDVRWSWFRFVLSIVGLSRRVTLDAYYSEEGEYLAQLLQSIKIAAEGLALFLTNCVTIATCRSSSPQDQLGRCVAGSCGGCSLTMVYVVMLPCDCISAIDSLQFCRSGGSTVPIKECWSSSTIACNAIPQPPRRKSLRSWIFPITTACTKRSQHNAAMRA